MRWGRNLRFSLRALSRSWVRTTLSASGVAVGIAAVVVLIGSGVGAERALRRALDPLGRNLLVISPARTETSALRGDSRIPTTLRVSDWIAINREVPGVLRAAPIAEGTLPARVGGRSVQVRATGTSPEFEAARNAPVVAGRFLDPQDLLDTARVAVVGALVVEELFRGESPLGETVSVGGVPFRVVGVTKKKGVSADGANEDDLVIVPLSTAMRRLLDVESLDRVYVQAISEESVPAVRAGIDRLLRDRHAGGPGEFRIVDQTATVRAQQQARGSLSRVVKALGTALLVLGGVGLLAVSLLSVRERYPEIGLRLAVGARPRDILFQFLAEAVLISALGGGLGVALGAAGILACASLTRWPMALAWQVVVYPWAISLGIAVVFGTYPAWRAARLDPVVALNLR